MLEIPSLLDRADVTRAARRAALYQKAGMTAVPAVAGEATTQDADDEAGRQAVSVMLDGRRLHGQEAAAKWLA